ncbi:MAG: translation initiation factor [Chloroflexota bacterium]|nr:translation initiation factor [Chloroflexota bacterium]
MKANEDVLTNILRKGVGMPPHSENSHIVYSTDGGRIRRSTNNAGDKHSQPKKSTPHPSDGIARVQRETKGHRGKTVTTISGIPLNDSALRDLATLLKRRCGTGGSVKDNIIMIQGDHCDILIAELKKQGYPAKRSGG